jgi:hypothetical protein
MEQPELGSVGPDSITLAMTWSWDRGWRTRLASRPSGSAVWREHLYEGLDEAELHAEISDHLADLLGLV